MSVDTLIGKGIKFPLEPTESGGVAYSESIERINQSLFIIFETPKGSRLMMPDFGSNLYLYKFEPLDDILIEKLRNTITEDIRRWEPRINLLDIKFMDNDVARDNNILYVYITYKIINTNVIGNYVYPFNRDVYNMNSDN